MKPYFSSRRVGACASVLSLILMLAAPATAQDRPAASTTETGRELEPVTVTGSRLRGVPGGEAWPLTLISREELLSTGQHRLGDILQQLPFTSGSPLNTATSERGQGGGLSRGIETIELRGLGPERTLVLLNGRRFVPGGNGASGVLDLGMLPLSMVERIEVFKSGASVEYGADALAGVINIITRRTMRGVEVSARSSVTSRADAETISISALSGREGAAGGFALGVEFTDQPSVSKADRRFSNTRLSFNGPDNQLVFDGSSAPPNGQFRTSLGRLTLIDGRDGESIDDFRPFINSGPNTDRFNFNPFEDLLQDSRRLTLFGNGQWFAGDTLTLHAEALYHRRDSSQQLAPLPFFTNRLSNVAVSADNLFNPFDEPISDVRRRLVEAGPRQFIQDNEAWRVVVGADGQIGGWFWDAAINHGRNETDQRQTGDLLADRVRRALGPSFIDAGGRARCGRPDAPVEDCVPLNLFGPPGSITEAMLADIGADLDDSGFNEQTVFDANLSGDLIELPAGMLALAAGVEWRKETGADRPDPQSRAGNTSGSARAPTLGSFDAREAYLELGVPLLADKPFARRLDLDLGGRVVRFNNFGADRVFEVGLGWQPLENLSLRASWSEAFRAPNIGELFGGQAQANPIVLDPCTDFNALNPVAVERCIAQGVPADGSFRQNGEETPELLGGNPALEPEHGDILTVGLGWLPLGDRGPRLRLDYYDIEIRDGIGALGANTVLQQCLATGAAEFCDAIQRGADGGIDSIAARLRNVARETARGFDLEADWRHSAGPGQLAHRVMLSRVEERSSRALAGAPALFGAGGYDPDNFGAIPEWRGSYDLKWHGASWSAGWRAHWIDALRETGGEVFPGTVNRVGSVLYHDLRIAWQPTQGLQIGAGISNLSDVQPPLLVNADEGNTDLGTYRALGRTFWLRLGLVRL